MVQKLEFKNDEFYFFSQRNRFQEAANAIFTYLTVHPKHEMSSKNLRYYLTLKEVDETQIRNLEISPFLEHYMKGVKNYGDELYEEAAVNFEKSLELYMKSEDECRFYCEGSFEQGWHPEFTSSIASESKSIFFSLLFYTNYGNLG